MKAAERAPSAKRSRSRFGMRNAIWNASAWSPAPRSAAKTCSRTTPSTRERSVSAEMRPAARRGPFRRPLAPPVSLTTALKDDKLSFCRRLRSPASALERRTGRSRVAHHASALKQMRQGLRRRARNRKNLSQVRTQIKKLREALAKGDADAARALLPETVGAIDKAAKKGVVHDNAAARYKSRLSRRLAALT